MRCRCERLPWMRPARTLRSLRYFCEPVGAVLRAREDERVLHLALLEQRGQQLGLAVLRHRVDGLRDARRRRGLARELDRGRIVQHLVRELRDRRRHRRAEEQRLPLASAAPRGCGGCRAGSPCRACGRPRRARAPASPPNVARARAHVVEQPAGRGDDQVAPLRKARCCGPIATPPYTAATVRRVCRARSWASSAICCGQLARGREHERAGLAARLGQQALEDGEQEGSGLAAARHGRSQHVAACEAGGNRLGLDRRGLFEAEVAERTRQARVQVQRGKRQEESFAKSALCLPELPAHEGTLG